MSAEVASAPAAMGDAAKAKKKRPVVKKTAATHPPTSEMVNTAITTLKDRKGTSLQAIKKYVASTWKVDPVRFNPIIRRYLKSAVVKGTLKQNKGSFRMGVKPKVPKKKKAKKPKAKTAKKAKAKKVKAKKPKSAKKSKKPKAKKPKQAKAAAKPKSKKPKAAKKPKAKKAAPKKAKK